LSTETSVDRLLELKKEGKREKVEMEEKECGERREKNVAHKRKTKFIKSYKNSENSFEKCKRIEGHAFGVRRVSLGASERLASWQIDVEGLAQVISTAVLNE
jgi:hypothetical protein